jgi:hypothetical protein
MLWQTMSDTPPANEDRRRPKSVPLYALLWGICVAAIVFALLAMWFQG